MSAPQPRAAAIPTAIDAAIEHCRRARLGLESDTADSPRGPQRGVLLEVIGGLLTIEGRLEKLRAA